MLKIIICLHTIILLMPLEVFGEERVIEDFLDQSWDKFEKMCGNGLPKIDVEKAIDEIKKDSDGLLRLQLEEWRKQAQQADADKDPRLLAWLKTLLGSPNDPPEQKPKPFDFTLASAKMPVEVQYMPATAKYVLTSFRETNSKDTIALEGDFFLLPFNFNLSLSLSPLKMSFHISRFPTLDGSIITAIAPFLKGRVIKVVLDSFPEYSKDVSASYGVQLGLPFLGTIQGFAGRDINISEKLTILPSTLSFYFFGKSVEHHLGRFKEGETNKMSVREYLLNHHKKEAFYSAFLMLKMVIRVIVANSIDMLKLCCEKVVGDASKFVEHRVSQLIKYLIGYDIGMTGRSSEIARFNAAAFHKETAVGSNRFFFPIISPEAMIGRHSSNKEGVIFWGFLSEVRECRDPLLNYRESFSTCKTCSTTTLILKRIRSLAMGLEAAYDKSVAAYVNQFRDSPLAKTAPLEAYRKVLTNPDHSIHSNLLLASRQYLSDDKNETQKYFEECKKRKPLIHTSNLQQYLSDLNLEKNVFVKMSTVVYDYCLQREVGNAIFTPRYRDRSSQSSLFPEQSPSSKIFHALMATARELEGSVIYAIKNWKERKIITHNNLCKNPRMIKIFCDIAGTAALVKDSCGDDGMREGFYTSFRKKFSGNIATRLLYGDENKYLWKARNDHNIATSLGASKLTEAVDAALDDSKGLEYHRVKDWCEKDACSEL